MLSVIAYAQWVEMRDATKSTILITWEVPPPTFEVSL